MPSHSIAYGNSKVAAALDFTQDETDQLKAKLLKLTEATVVVRGPKRDEHGHCIYIEVPDVGVQLAATVKALEFAVGKPKQMLEVKSGNNTPIRSSNLNDLGRMLMKNPDLVHKLIATMKDGLKVEQAIDVTPTSATSANPPVESQSIGSPSDGR